MPEENMQDTVEEEKNLGQNIINKEIHYRPLHTLDIDNPEYIKLLNHQLKQKILYILIREETSLKKIAEELDTNPGTIKRHLTDLMNADLIVQPFTETNQFNFKIKYYRARARKFKLAYEWPPD